jgi:hypothetical protein
MDLNQQLYPWNWSKVRRATPIIEEYRFDREIESVKQFLRIGCPSGGETVTACSLDVDILYIATNDAPCPSSSGWMTRDPRRLPRVTFRIAHARNRSFSPPKHHRFHVKR